MRINFKAFIILILFIYVEQQEYKKADIPFSSVELINEEFREFKLISKQIVNEPIFSCRFGGKPLAIWSFPSDSEIDSEIPHQPIFIEEGYTASSFSVDEIVKSDIKDKNKFYIKAKNPSYGGVYLHLYRDEAFYVTTMVFPPSMSDKSNSTVNNFEINIEYDDIDQSKTLTGGAVPSRGYNYISAVYSFIYEWGNYIESYHVAWDQKTDWSDYFGSYTQDIYYKVVPEDIDGRNIGHGFWICGDNEEDQVSKMNKLHKKNKKLEILTIK